MSLSARPRKWRRLSSWRYPSRPWWKGEVEVVREGRRVYVRMHGPEDLSDEELLPQAIARDEELQRTVWELDGRASELEKERDEARESAATARRPYEELQEAYRKESAAHGRTRGLALRLGLVAATLLVISALLTWRLLT